MDRPCKHNSSAKDYHVELAQAASPVPVNGPIPGYLEIVPNDGYNHIAFFSPFNATTPTWITSGEWEVSQISAVDEQRNMMLVSFLDLVPSSDIRNIAISSRPPHPSIATCMRPIYLHHSRPRSMKSIPLRLQT